MKTNGHASLDGLLDALAQRVGGAATSRDDDAVAGLSHRLDHLTSVVERLVQAVEAKTPGVEPLLLDRREAARTLSVSPSMLDSLRRDGKLAATVVGTKPMFSTTDLRQFVDAHREKRAPDGPAPEI
jgi:hypothetical protein